MYNGVNSLVLPIFNIGLGVDAVKLGFAIGLPRFLDAISDPIIGHISDNARTRWGRRRPFIFCAALLVGLLIGVLFSPNPQWSKDALFWWFLIWGALFYLAYAVFVIPYSALGLEITSDYNVTYQPNVAMNRLIASNRSRASAAAASVPSTAPLTPSYVRPTTQGGGGFPAPTKVAAIVKGINRDYHATVQANVSMNKAIAHIKRLHT